MDNHATTQVDPRVLEAMLPYFTHQFGNAASIDHIYGHSAQKDVETARESIAGILGASSPKEIVFTSGATESDNIAILGIAEAYKEKGNHIITTTIEHKAVLECTDILREKGFSITLISPDSKGLINSADVAQAIRPETILVSVMFANNEIGTIQPIQRIGEITRENGVFFHTDAAQAVGHLDINVQKMNIDLMSFTAHKIYGPKGVGGLFVTRKNPRVIPAGVIHGGGHERGIRSGTLNTPGIIGLSRALEIAANERTQETERLRKLSSDMLTRLESSVDGLELNGDPEKRLAHNLNIYIPGVESKSVLMDLLGTVAFSAGSACTTAKIEPSHVIEALNLGAQRAYNSLRFGLGRFTTREEVVKTAESVAESVKKIRQTFI